MKYIFCFLFVFIIGKNVNSAPIFFSWGGENIVKVVDFPDNENFLSSDNRYFDAGYRYKQVSIFFIPVWNYDLNWCGYISDKYYLDLSKNQLGEYANLAQVALPDEPELDFWNKFGGKLLFLSVVIIYIMYSVYFKKDT